MIRRINRLISALIVVALALWVVVFNRDTVTVYYSATGSITAGLGLILIGTFVLGILLTTLVAAVLGFFAYLRESRLRKREADRMSLYAGIVETRGYIASGELKRAQARLHQLTKKDPELLLIKLELARTAQKLGEYEYATSVVEEIRTSHPTCVEALVLSIELSRARGNLTSALDGAKRATQEIPSEYLLIVTRDLACELKDYVTALEYQKQLEAQFGATPDRSAKRLELEAMVVAGDHTSPPESRYQKLLGYARNPEATGAVFKLLREFESPSADLQAHAALVAKAATNQGSRELFIASSDAWLRAGEPDRAVATLRTAAKELTGAERTAVLIRLAAVLLDLSKVSDASEVIRQIEDGRDTHLELALLRANLAHASNEPRALSAALRDSLKTAHLSR